MKIAQQQGEMNRERYSILGGGLLIRLSRTTHAVRIVWRFVKMRKRAYNRDKGSTIKNRTRPEQSKEDSPSRLP